MVGESGEGVAVGVEAGHAEVRLLRRSLGEVAARLLGVTLLAAFF
jgi:hypothetical protein